MRLSKLAADCLYDPKKYHRAQKGYQQGWDRDGIIDRSDAKQGAEEVTGQECADDAHYDVKQQALL